MQMNLLLRSAYPYLCRMLPEFIRYLEAERRYSPLTVRNYRRDVERFLDWLGVDEASFDPRQLTSAELREWIILRSEEGRLSAAAMNREIASLRTLFRWLLREERIDRDLFSRIPSLRTSHRLPVFVPESRMREVLDDCEAPAGAFIAERDALIVLLFYACGLRLAELVGIDRDDFSDDFRNLRVRGKGDKERLLPLLDPVRERILHHIETIRRQQICKNDEKALFLSRQGRRISRTTVYRIVQEQLAKSGVQGKKSPHVLRHTFATHLLNDGADMREIQELMGHASLQATQVYTHNDIARLQAVYALAHPRNRTAAETGGSGRPICGASCEPAAPAEDATDGGPLRRTPDK